MVSNNIMRIFDYTYLYVYYQCQWAWDGIETRCLLSTIEWNCVISMHPRLVRLLTPDVIMRYQLSRWQSGSQVSYSYFYFVKIFDDFYDLTASRTALNTSSTGLGYNVSHTKSVSSPATNNCLALLTCQTPRDSRPVTAIPGWIFCHLWLVT